MAELDVTQMRLDIDALSTNKEDKASLKALAYKESLAESDIPNLSASKITSGSFASDRIPSLDASKITSGSFNSDRIPGLDASKIESGVLPVANGGTGGTTGAEAMDELGVDDYVVACGNFANSNLAGNNIGVSDVNGVWKKYASGVATIDCYIGANVTSQSTWDNMRYSNTFNWVLPFNLTGWESILGACHSNISFIGNHGIINGNVLKFNICSAHSLANDSYGTSFRIVGWWK